MALGFFWCARIKRDEIPEDGHAFYDDSAVTDYECWGLGREDVALMSARSDFQILLSLVERFSRLLNCLIFFHASCD